MIRDSELEQWVLRELRLEPNARSKEICVYASDGIVTLRGTAHTQTQRLAAQRAALRANAAKTVINDLHVLRRETSYKTAPGPAPQNSFTALKPIPIDDRQVVISTQRT